MTIDLTFDGSTECRGRNGWFQLREAHMYSSVEQPWEGPAYRSASVWLYSKQHGKFAPIFLKFNEPDELRTLICGLAKALAQMTQKEDENGEVA